MIVKNATSTRTKQQRLLLAIGKLADTTLSADSTQAAINELTRELQGEPCTEETFKKYNIDAKIVKEDNKPEILIVSVPNEYLPNNLKSLNSAEVSFTLSKVLDTNFIGR